MNGVMEGLDLNSNVLLEEDGENCRVPMIETILKNSADGSASGEGKVKIHAEASSRDDAATGAEGEAENTSLPVEGPGALVRDGGGGGSGNVVVKTSVEVVEVVTGGPDEKVVPLDEGGGVQIRGKDEEPNVSEWVGESSDRVPDCGMGNISEDLDGNKKEDSPIIGSNPDEKIEDSNAELLEYHADGFGDKIVMVTNSKHIDVVGEEVTAVDGGSPVVNTETSGESMVMDVDYVAPEGQNIGLSKERNASEVQESDDACDPHAESHSRKKEGMVEAEASDGNQENGEQDVSTEEEVGQGFSCWKDDENNPATGRVNSLDAQDHVTGVTHDAGKADPISVGSQENGIIETNESKDVENRPAGVDDPSIREHPVSEGDRIEEAKGDQRVELKEANVDTKADHLSALEKTEGLGGQKAQESMNEETDEEMEDVELHENSYFELVLPEVVPSQEDDEFSVGDLVWGKIKSHPWWPGQIFHYEDSSEKALQYCRKDTRLVAFFGDGTFAWCDESQLKPFWKNFAHMSRQSSLSSFLYAVDRAVEEASRRMELGFTCKCLPEEAYNRLKSPEIVNAGVRGGVTVPDDVEKSLLVASFKPEIFLEYVKELALFCPGKSINKLELAFVQAQLSAIYSAKGYTKLPSFHIYDGISGEEPGLSPLKDSHAGVGLATPSHEAGEQITLGSLSESGEGKTKGSSSRKRRRVLEESPIRSRKKKSLAELMNVGKYVKSSQKKVRNSGSSGKKKISGSGSELRDGDDNVKSGRHKEKKKSKSISSSSGKKKKAVVSDSEPVRDDNGENSKRTRERSMSITPSSRKRGGKSKSISLSSRENNDTSVSDSVKSSRKKRRLASSKDSEIAVNGDKDDDEKESNSQFISPPSYRSHKKVDGFVTPGGSAQKKRSSDLSGDSDTKTPAQKSFNIGERITKISSKLTGPLPLTKSNKDTSPKDVTDFRMGDGKVSGENATSLTPESKGPRRKRLPKVTISPDELLLLLYAAAHDPLCGTDERSQLIDFFTDFRDSSYEKGSSYKWYNKSLEKVGHKSDKRASSETEANGGNASNSKSGLKRSSGPKSGKRKTLNASDVDRSSSEEELLKNKHKKEAKLSKENSGTKQRRSAKSAKVGADKDLPAGDAIIASSSRGTEGESGTYSSDEKSGGESSPTALILSFTEGDALPSESDLSRIFSRYGPLEESETEVLRKTSRARVVFKRRSDAEVAFSSAGKYSIFGPSLVSYRLRYLSSTSKDSPRRTMRCIKDAASAEGNVVSPFPGEDELRDSAEAQN